MTLGWLLAQCRPGACVPIALVDWNVIRGTPARGYQGHFVPIVGYDAAHVFVHDPERAARGGRGARCAVPRDVFDAARRADGTDEDVVFVGPGFAQVEADDDEQATRARFYGLVGRLS